MKVVAGVDDLMFVPKIQIASRETGVPVTFADNRESLVAELTEASVVLLDLDAPAYDPLNLIPELAARGDCRVVAFVSHVETDVARRAREAGADRVLSRSQFFQALPAILRS